MHIPWKSNERTDVTSDVLRHKMTGSPRSPDGHWQVHVNSIRQQRRAWRCPCRHPSTACTVPLAFAQHIPVIARLVA